ncbi:MAG: 2-phospho-L-lactate transferase CofD family protein [Candidatus Magasanikbacteria bacterium]
MKKKKIVIIGGGNGSAIVIGGLKHNPAYDLSAVTSMSDSGFSSGAMRRYFHLPSPGDILRAVLAMSKYDYSLLRTIFNKNRFDSLVNVNKKLKAARAPSLGNLFLMLAAQFEGDYVRAVRALEEAVEAVGHAYPVTLDLTDLGVQLSNGKIVKTEGVIDRPSYNRAWKIQKAWLEPAGRIYAGAKKVIESADYIILCPGSLYCSVIAALLPRGVKEAIKKSRAKLIYVAGNGYETVGETGPQRFSDFVKQLERYLPRPVDLVVYNNQQLNKSQQKKYRLKNWAKYDYDPQNLSNHKIIAKPFERNEGGLCDVKLGKILNSILK